MRKLLLITLILNVFVSCKINRNNFASEKEEIFDSTYYMLKKAYSDKDTILLNDFFEKWSEASLKMEMQNENEIAKILNDIYTEIYHPFDFKKYGWQYRYYCPKYAILPTEIKFKVVDSTIKCDFDKFNYGANMDTLKPFYPNPDLEHAGRLLDIEPFKTAMKLFLEKDSYEKLKFVGSCNHIYTPISNGWKDYQTTPKIYCVLINKQLNKAIAYLRIISTGVCIELSFENDKWNMEKVTDIWIE